MINPKFTVVSGGHGEAAGPRHLLLRGQGDLQEAERLQLAGAAQGGDIDGARAGGGNHIGEQRLGLGVVACDQDGSGRFAGGAGGKGGGEVGVERLEDRGVRQRGGDLCGRGAVGRGR